MRRKERAEYYTRRAQEVRAAATNQAAQCERDRLIELAEDYTLMARRIYERLEREKAHRVRQAAKALQTAAQFLPPSERDRFFTMASVMTAMRPPTE